MKLTNKDISELLARRADETDEHRRRAYQRAARAALMWPSEAADLVDLDRSLTELHNVGDKLAGRIKAWIEDPPELEETPALRRDFMTMAQARALLADHPEWPKLRGDLQMHTVLSDGKASVAEMARRGAELGYEYIAITDHSKGLRIAGGADEAAFAAQSQEIDRVNEAIGDGGFRVLKSMEMNIDGNGEGDMDPHVFELFDLVLGSFHSQLRTTEDQTPRYLAALDNQDIQIIGHPRGRKFNNRLGLSADWRSVLDAAAEAGKALEINSYPDRQDLSAAILEQARPDNVFSIGTDAHNPDEMLLFEYGLAQALAAGLEPKQIVNFWSVQEVQDWAAARN
ncbi:MAG: PHP domain-containing protein [Actinomycetota bacterium]|nr:PHP domain-containing protein [Actinomycetota bacterium]